jgi:hypothetical protein
LKTLDAFGLCISVLWNVALLYKFGLVDEEPGMAWHHAMCIFYLITAVMQLCLLLVAPAYHQKQRFAFTLANRLVKLLGFTLVAFNMANPTIVSRMTSTFNREQQWCSSTPNSTSSSSWNPADIIISSSCLTDSNSTMAKSSSVASKFYTTNTSSLNQDQAEVYMDLLRPVLSPPMIWLSHALNFVLPFCLVLPIQLFTLAMSTLVIRSTVCTLAKDTANIHSAEKICKLSMSYASVALGMATADPEEGTPAGCQGLAAMLWLVLATYVVLLLVLPCLCIYLVEWSLKFNFVKAKGLKLSSQWALECSGMVHCLVVYTALVAAVLLCNALVQSVSPVSCTSSGLLVLEGGLGFF